MAFVPLVLTYLASALSMTVVSVALPTISTQFQADAQQLVWVVNITQIASAALILFAGSWGDRFGGKRLLMIGIVVFLTAAVLSAFSTNITELIILRAVTGIGSALTLPAALALTFTVVPKHSQRTAVGLIASMQAVGLLLGPVLAGALLVRFWWGAALLSVVPFLLVALALAWWKLPAGGADRAGERSDVGGATLMALTAILLLSAAVRGGTTGALDGPVLLLTAGGLGSLALLVAWERRCPNPIFVGRALRQRTFWLPTLVVMSVQFVMGGVLFVNTQYVQLALGLSAFAAAAFLLPALAMSVVASATAGLTARWFGVRIVSATGLGLSAIGLVLVGSGGLNPNYAILIPGLVLLGCMGVAPALMTHMAVDGYLPERRTVGSAVNNVAMRFGLAFGVAGFGSLMAATFARGLSPALQGLPSLPGGTDPTNSLGAALQASASFGGPVGTRVADAARLAFSDAFRTTLVSAAVLLVVFMVLVLVASPSSGRTGLAAPGPQAEDTVSSSG